jgi:protein-S-isoprenylcysteine O-methyltransferase Ste14
MYIGIKAEWSRNPIKQQLVKAIIVVLGSCAFLAGLLAYYWAWKIFENGIFR